MSFIEKPFSIISDNCWGGQLSHHLGHPNRSPFIGLFMFAPDYIEMLFNLKHYLSLDLSFIEEGMSRYATQLREFGTLGKYPIGVLGTLEVHFLHYANEQEAREKWMRRRDRVNHDYLIVKFNDRGLATPELIQTFDKLPFNNKLCLTAKHYDLASCIKLNNENGACVENEWENFLNTIDPRVLLQKFQM